MAEFKESLSGWGYFAAFLMFVAAPGLFVWQCYRWMRDGVWPSVSVITALRWAQAPDQVTWASWPTDWIGLYKLLDAIPLSLVLLAFAIFAGWLGSVLSIPTRSVANAAPPGKRSEK